MTIQETEFECQRFSDVLFSQLKICVGWYLKPRILICWLLVHSLHFQSLKLQISTLNLTLTTEHGWGTFPNQPFYCQVYAYVLCTHCEIYWGSKSKGLQKDTTHTPEDESGGFGHLRLQVGKHNRSDKRHLNCNTGYRTMLKRNMYNEKQQQYDPLSKLYHPNTSVALAGRYLFKMIHFTVSNSKK